MAKPSRVSAQKTRAPARRRRKKRALRDGRPTADIHASVVLRTPKREIALRTDTPSEVNLAQAAMRWTYVVRSRQRWSAAPDAEKRQSLAARELLQQLGIDDAALADLAQGGMIEVSTNWLGNEEDGWAARILPWEYVIAGATHSLRNGVPLTVTRHLNRGDTQTPKTPIKRVLFVASEPGPLQGHYKFDTERDVVRTSLKVAQNDWHELDSPTSDQLRDAISSFRPDIVHLAGFDTHFARFLLLQSDKQAAAHLEDELAEGRGGADEIKDGYVLAGPQGLHPIRAEDLGRLLTDDNHRPRLVALNVGNSAARCAPLAVAEGAWAAIGFQDTFNEELAEFFFSVLYSRIGRSGLDLNHAFRSAWERVRIQPGHHQGTGVVLWNATPAFAQPHARWTGASDRRQQKLSEQLKTQEETPLEAGEVKAGDSEKWVTVDVETHEDLNYSMLHNQRPLFKKFVINSREPRTIRNLRVKVSLSTGTDTAFFDRTLNVKYPFFDLNPHIHVPLTSSITRSIHESVRTSLFVEATWGEHVLYRDTKRVRLTPVDQWRDSDSDRKWLPAFVFPRDAAVTRLVDTAQRYVRVLRDDPAAGFDGYQSFDPKHPESTTEIDLQVQAIWSAIVHEMRLGYINPPPGYSSELDSQRLRTPTMIARDHSGTCVDLALFFAACLELVDIYPVIFLLEGHAFTGYWRASDYHDEFKEARPEGIQDIVRANSQATGVFGAQIETWFLGKPTYREIVQLVNAGKLVPIETVRLTENSGFSEAVDAGRDNLRVQREFEAMVDIALAREKQVTPLPILGEPT
jgi:hypothetical protein